MFVKFNISDFTLYKISKKLGVSHSFSDENVSIFEYFVKEEKKENCKQAIEETFRNKDFLAQGRLTTQWEQIQSLPDRFKFNNDNVGTENKHKYSGNKANATTTSLEGYEEQLNSVTIDGGRIEGVEEFVEWQDSEGNSHNVIGKQLYRNSEGHVIGVGLITDRVDIRSIPDTTSEKDEDYIDKGFHQIMIGSTGQSKNAMKQIQERHGTLLDGQFKSAHSLYDYDEKGHKKQGKDIQDASRANFNSKGADGYQQAKSMIVQNAILHREEVESGLSKEQIDKFDDNMDIISEQIVKNVEDSDVKFDLDTILDANGFSGLDEDKKQHMKDYVFLNMASRGNAKTQQEDLLNFGLKGRSLGVDAHDRYGAKMLAQSAVALKNMFVDLDGENPELLRQVVRMHGIDMDSPEFKEIKKGLLDPMVEAIDEKTSSEKSIRARASGSGRKFVSQVKKIMEEDPKDPISREGEDVKIDPDFLDKPGSFQTDDGSIGISKYAEIAGTLVTANHQYAVMTGKKMSNRSIGAEIHHSFVRLSQSWELDEDGNRKGTYYSENEVSLEIRDKQFPEGEDGLRQPPTDETVVSGIDPVNSPNNAIELTAQAHYLEHRIIQNTLDNVTRSGNRQAGYSVHNHTPEMIQINLGQSSKQKSKLKIKNKENGSEVQEMDMMLGIYAPSSGLGSKKVMNALSTATTYGNAVEVTKPNEVQEIKETKEETKEKKKPKKKSKKKKKKK